MPYDPSEFAQPQPFQTPSVPSFPKQPTNPQDVEGLVRFHAKKNGVDPDLAANLARTESSFNPAAKNADTGASGVMQLMPKTAEGLGVKNIMDANENADAGTRYLKQLIDKNKGDTRAALAEYGGFKTKDPSDYVNKVMGVSSSGNQGKLFDPSEFAPAKPIDYQSAALTGALDPSSLQSKLQAAGQMVGDVGRASVPYIPWAIGGVTAALSGPFAPVAAPLAVGLSRLAEQAAGVQQGKQTKEGMWKNVLEDINTEAKGQIAGEGLATIAPGLAKYVYRKTLGIDPDNPLQTQAISDMVERHIPGGPGRKMVMKNLKTTENEGLNEVYSKWGNKPPGAQVPGLVPTGVAGQMSAQQGASYAPPVAVNKNNLAMKLVNAINSEPTMSMADRKAITDAYKNFVDVHPDEDISLNDVRKIMNNLSKKVSFADPEAVGKMQGQKIVHHYLGETAQEAIPDAGDAAKFANHRDELHKLINIEELQGFGRVSKIPGMEVTSPLAGGIIGQSSGYYSHMNPYAAAARGLGARVLSGAPNVAAHLANSPWARQAAIGASGAISQNSQPTVNLSPDELNKILRSFDGQQQ